MIKPTCTEPECQSPHEAQGFCNRHYKRKRQAGLLPRLEKTLRSRFEAKVNRAGPIPEDAPELGPCHDWTGGTNKKGYGAIYDSTTGSMRGAHVIAWELENGPVPEGTQVDHRCHRPICVNGRHLRLVTNNQNQQNRKGAAKRRAERVSRHRGVTWHKPTQRWRVTVGVDGRQHAGGYFPPEQEEAAGQAAVELRARLHTHSDGR